MNKHIHILYGTLLVAALFTGSLIGKASSPAPAAMTLAAHDEAGCDAVAPTYIEVDSPRETASTQRDARTSQQRKAASVKPRKALTEMELIAHEQALLAERRQAHLTRLATAVGIDSPSGAALGADGVTVYRAIEEQLLSLPMDDSDRLDYIDDYLTSFRRQASVDFTRELLAQAPFMVESDQVQLLQIMQQQSIANRGNEVTEYQAALTEGIEQFKDSADEQVRYAVLIALSEALKYDERLEQELEYFLADASETVRAKALVIMRDR